MQTEIDAAASIRDQKLAEARVAGANRLGTSAAVDARSGNLGGDFAAAHTKNITDQNTGIEGGIQDEYNANVASITDKGYQEANSEIAAKRAALQGNADSYIKFLTASTERQGVRTDNAAKAALAKGIDLTADPASAKAIADAYKIEPDALISSYQAAKTAAAAAQKANIVESPITSNAYTVGADGKVTQIQQGTATPDSTLKEYQAAVAQGFTGSLLDFKSQNANLKVSVGLKTNPINGQQSTYTKTGPGVAGTGTPAPAVSKPTATTAAPVPATPAVPPKGEVQNPLDTLSGSDLAYAQTGVPTQAKFKYPTQIDEATKRIQSVIPGWTPANAAAQAAFFKSPDTQKFIANSNTVLNTINDPNNGLKALSSKVDRSNIVVANNGLLSLKRSTSDPDTAKFVQLSNIAADEIGKILGSGQGSDFTIQLGQTLVNPAYSQSTFNATMDNLDSRIRNKVNEFYSQAGRTNPNAAAPSGPAATTVMTGPDGKQYHVPNDKVDAFKAAGGH